MRTILLIVLGLIIAQNGYAQVDSLIIKLGDYGQMIVISPNLVTEKHKSFGLDSSYRSFYHEFKKIDKSINPDKNYLIQVETKKPWEDQRNRSITVTSYDSRKDVFYFQDGKEQSLKSFQFKLELATLRKVILWVDSLNDFEKISQLRLDSLYVQSLNHLQNQDLNKRPPYKIFYEVDNNKINESTNLIISGKSQDLLLGYATFGMSMINSTFAPDISFNLDFELKSKGITEYKFGINGTFLFMPDKNDFYNVTTYPFLNLSYGFGFNNKWDHKISVGYLLGKGGNEFSKNTLNAYYQTNINKIGFKLGCYYTENTEGKRVLLPSIGFDFGF